MIDILRSKGLKIIVKEDDLGHWPPKWPDLTPLSVLLLFLSKNI